MNNKHDMLLLNLAIVVIDIYKIRNSVSRIHLIGGSEIGFYTWKSGKVTAFGIEYNIGDNKTLNFQCTGTGPLFALKENGQIKIIWSLQK